MPCNTDHQHHISGLEESLQRSHQYAMDGLVPQHYHLSTQLCNSSNASEHVTKSLMLADGQYHVTLKCLAEVHTQTPLHFHITSKLALDFATHKRVVQLIFWHRLIEFN